MGRLRQLVTAKGVIHYWFNRMEIDSRVRIGTDGGFQSEWVNGLSGNMQIVKPNQIHESAVVPLLFTFLITQIWQIGG